MMWEAITQEAINQGWWQQWKERFINNPKEKSYREPSRTMNVCTLRLQTTDVTWPQARSAKEESCTSFNFQIKISNENRVTSIFNYLSFSLSFLETSSVGVESKSVFMESLSNPGNIMTNRKLRSWITTYLFSSSESQPANQSWLFSGDNKRNNSEFP